MLHDLSFTVLGNPLPTISRKVTQYPRGNTIRQQQGHV